MKALKATLRGDLTAAIRARDEIAVATLRMALSAIRIEEVSGRAARELTDAEVVAVVSREARRRQEAADAFAAAGRGELADRELAELEVLRRYLPEPLSVEQVAAMVAAAVRAAAADGETGPPALGRLMRELAPQTAGRFDGARLAELVRTALSPDDRGSEGSDDSAHDEGT